MPFSIMLKKLLKRSQHKTAEPYLPLLSPAPSHEAPRPIKILTPAEERNKWLLEISSYDIDAWWIKLVISKLDASGKYPTLQSLLDVVTEKFSEELRLALEFSPKEKEFLQVLGTDTGPAAHLVRNLMRPAAITRRLKRIETEFTFCCKLMYQEGCHKKNWLACNCVVKKVPVCLYETEGRESLIQALGPASRMPTEWLAGKGYYHRH